MKIIISPAKVQNGKDTIPMSLEPILFHSKTNHLNDLLMGYSKASLGKLMKIKGKLLDQTYYNLHQHTEPVHAITLYNGIVFKEINAGSYELPQLEYMNRHLRILSAYYGVLKPTSGIIPYRLDMTMKPQEKNLYLYWDESVNEHFADDELLINLASLEFSKMVDKPMLNIHFKEEQSNGSLKIITVRAKKARGLMVDYLISNMIENPNEIKNFCEMDYQFSENLSDNQNFIFILPYE